LLTVFFVWFPIHEGISVSSVEQATWWDHYQLNFCLWAAIHDGEAYLAASNNTHLILRQKLPGTRLSMDEFQNARRIEELEKYHFITSLGRAMRKLRRAQHIFPTVQPIYSESNHLINEAKTLRDMIEHSDDYEQGKGREQASFVREGPEVNLPGDRPGTADATSTIINNEGHWLGGRLCVEKAMAELRAIATEAEKIPAPRSK
jgi:hypothetical protein